MRTKPYLKENNRIISNKRLRIKKIVIKTDFVKIVIEHWEFKWIEHLATLWHNGIHYEFGYSDFSVFNEDFRKKHEDKLFIFELIMPNRFIEKYNLNDFAYHRVDKYETDLLFERRIEKLKKTQNKGDKKK